jgi:glycosyltransferase involved in cell wall biosynthesis
VLPTISENFGLVIGEALAHRRPVITTTGAPWQGIIDHGCGWWIAATQNALVEAFQEALPKSREALVAMGDRGAAWMRTDFTWESESRLLLETYEWLLGSGASRPDFVNLDDVDRA